MSIKAPSPSPSHAPPRVPAEKQPKRAHARPARGSSFASHLDRGLRKSGHGALGAEAPPTPHRSGGGAATRSVHHRGEDPRGARASADVPDDVGADATALPESVSEAVPFRPLPSCVFAPAGQARALPAPPTVDVAQLAGELLRSLQVGGTRGRAQVRLLLGGSAGQGDLEVTLEETATGVCATLHTDDGEHTRRLMRALERELARRSIEVDCVAR